MCLCFVVWFYRRVCTLFVVVCCFAIVVWYLFVGCCVLFVVDCSWLFVVRCTLCAVMCLCFVV